MKMFRFPIGVVLVATMLLSLGCNVQDPSKQDEKTTQATEQDSVPPVVTPPVSEPKEDAASVADLDAGLKLILPRIQLLTDAHKKIEPRYSRLFMHPDEAKNAIVEIDTKGLTSVTLSPYMFDLKGQADCEANKDAGVVDVAWSIDGGKPQKVTVDRKYHELATLDLTNTSRLKIEVSAGNDVIWCDWAGIGFTNVKP
jgi:hypothetical protein